MSLVQGLHLTTNSIGWVLGLLQNKQVKEEKARKSTFQGQLRGPTDTNLSATTNSIPF